MHSRNQMEIEEDYNQAKRDLLRSIIDTGDDYPEFYNSSEDSSISSISSSSNDMDVDKPSENNEEVKEQNIVLYDRQEENDRKNFINMFKTRIHIQMLIVLQTQIFYHGIDQKYIMFTNIILCIENFQKIEEIQIAF